MPQISRNPLPPWVEQRMLDLLAECLASCQSKDTVAAFLNSLFTTTEKRMIAKRLAVAVMLKRGIHPVDIQNLLHVSLTTINTVVTWLAVKGDGFHEPIAGAVKRVKQRQELRQQRIAEANPILPPRGKNWKEWYGEKWERVKEISDLPF